MLGERIKHPESTNFYDDEEVTERSTKRLKTENRTPVSRSSPKRTAKNVIPDSEDELDDVDEESGVVSRGTDLETALPQVSTDQEAIDEYETSRASLAVEGGTDAITGRLDGRKWIKGKSSIYVDAFNLALETVLDEESNLFDDAEKALFEYWRCLSYEAQYL
jgi:Fanconi-associated nuclease 1